MRKFLKTTIPLLLTPLLAMAQIPTDVPKPDENLPVDFSNPANIIIYIVLPLAMILLYFIWRRKVKNEKDKKDS